ncbi:MAG TPA: M15 family metallopeptidase [Candidatus Sulfotelmatobacter sp.]|jgi:D-alanyl-D-alanine dipeptidase|nr:M15 family metallopeptidase [Candidatus Sulfotelmatobacter sp.]
MKSFRDRFIAIVLSILALESAAAQATIPLVDIKSVDPTIAIELRYSGSNNLAGRALYSRGTPALVRPEVASRLVRAQAFLGRYLYRLKIWDAYRPKSVQAELWQVASNNDYVADPETGLGSMHTWGIAVDATLTDACNHFVRMPTDFDELTPAAMLHYQGTDPITRSHLTLLQKAMGHSGFYGLHTEWWHFIISNWKKYVPAIEAKQVPQELQQNDRLFSRNSAPITTP